MKKIYDNFKTKLRQNWQKLMNSHHRKLSAGSESIVTLVNKPQGDSWRRHEAKKPKKD